MRCEYDGTELTPRERCPSCELYNAGVMAQQAAAAHIAMSYHLRAKDAWLNDHGVFAWIDGVTVQVGTPEQAAPFIDVTRAARRVTEFRRATPAKGAGQR